MNRIAAGALLIVSLASLSGVDQTAAGDAIALDKPVRLEADGKIIDTGDNWGHSGPCIADADGDGIADLVVGDFSGKFRVYRNLARSGQPRLGTMSYLNAGGSSAAVPISCCIGSSPQFVDFDADRKLDLISGSYDPGACYLFRGLGNGLYASRETISDAQGKPLLRNPNQRQEHESYGSWPVMIDWDADGDLDLLIGGFAGTMHVNLNRGTRNKPLFAASNFNVQSDGKDLVVPGGHAAIAIADWDADGRWDILSGCDMGSVYWYRNIGTPATPEFDAARVLVEEHRGTGYDELRECDAASVPGIRSQIAVADYDRDGLLDLLLGDFCSTLTPKPGLNADQRTEMHSILAERKAAVAGLSSRRERLQEDFKQRYPGDQLFSDPAEAEWNKAYSAMRSDKAHQELESRVKRTELRLSALIERPERPRVVNGLSASHGYVWLYRRKSVAAPMAAASQTSTAEGAIATGRFNRSPVHAVAAVDQRQARPGETITLTIDLMIGVGWHVAPIKLSDASEEGAVRSGPSVPTHLALKLPDALSTAGEWEVPKPDGGDAKSGPVYTGKVQFTRRLAIRSNAAAGAIELQCVVTCQPCNKSQCLRPAKITVRVPVEITSAK